MNTAERSVELQRMYDVPRAPGFQIKRTVSHWAYPANGNVHKPTPYFYYSLFLDGRLVDRSTRERVLRKAAQAPGARHEYAQGFTE